MPDQQIRAVFDDTSITVYQAYPIAIAEPATSSQTFVAPFKRGRMTWVKPSFLWMMYRSGWARKPGQERVLAIRITRAGFEEALASAVLSHHDATVYSSEALWRNLASRAHVKVQWDPERDLSLRPLPWRSLQLGISGPFVDRYLDAWIVSITDMTEQVRAIFDASDAALLPNEHPYPLSDALARRIGAVRRSADSSPTRESELG